MCGLESRFHTLSFLPQLWYFWRRRLFIWISFLDSYFELLLYVGPHSSFTSGPGEVAWQRAQAGFRGEDPGPGGPRGVEPEARLTSPAVQLGVPFAPIRVEHLLTLTVP